MAKTKVPQPGFEQLLRELEGAVAELEHGQLSLEQMLEKYAAGVELLRSCREILLQAGQLLPEGAGEGEAWS
jgi:exodeoxyribonuclease VII small subunit